MGWVGLLGCQGYESAGYFCLLPSSLRQPQYQQPGVWKQNYQHQNPSTAAAQQSSIQVEYLCREKRRALFTFHSLLPVSYFCGLEVSIVHVFCLWFLFMDQWLFTIKPLQPGEMWAEDVLSRVRACFN